MKLTSRMIKAKAAELGIDCIAIGNIERFEGAPYLMSPKTYFPALHGKLGQRVEKRA